MKPPWMSTRLIMTTTCIQGRDTSFCVVVGQLDQSIPHLFFPSTDRHHYYFELETVLFLLIRTEVIVAVDVGFSEDRMMDR